MQVGRHGRKASDVMVSVTKFSNWPKHPISSRSFGQQELEFSCCCYAAFATYLTPSSMARWTLRGWWTGKPKGGTAVESLSPKASDRLVGMSPSEIAFAI